MPWWQWTHLTWSCRYNKFKNSFTIAPKICIILKILEIYCECEVEIKVSIIVAVVSAWTLYRAQFFSRPVFAAPHPCLLVAIFFYLLGFTSAIVCTFRPSSRSYLYAANKLHAAVEYRDIKFVLLVVRCTVWEQSGSSGEWNLTGMTNVAANSGSDGESLQCLPFWSILCHCDVTRAQKQQYPPENQRVFNHLYFFKCLFLDRYGMRG
jgi:hypothetical protein